MRVTMPTGMDEMVDTYAPFEHHLRLVALRALPLRVYAGARTDGLIALLQLRQRKLRRQVPPIPARNQQEDVPKQPAQIPIEPLLQAGNKHLGGRTRIPGGL